MDDDDKCPVEGEPSDPTTAVHAQVGRQPAKPDGHSRQGGSEETGDTKWLQRAETFFAFAVALFTGVQVWVSNRQWTAMQETNKIAARALEGDQRAWVLFDPERVGMADLEVGTGSLVRGGVRNFGKGPAINVGSVVATRIDERGLTAFPPFDQASPQLRTMTPSGVLGPEQRLDFIVYTPLITDDELAQVNKAEKRLYVYGTIKYEDGFGKPRFTRFCSFYVGEGPDGKPLFSLCQGRGLNEAW